MKIKPNLDLVAIEQNHALPLRLAQYGGDYIDLLNRHTRLERQHESLKETHAKLAEATDILGRLNPSPDTLCLIADQKGHIQFTSNSASAILGLRKNKITRLQQLVTPFHLPHLDIMLQSLSHADSKKWSDQSEFFLHSEGEAGQDHLFITVIFPLTLGNSPYTCWVLRDVSITALETDNRGRLPHLQHSLHQGSLVTDPSGTILGLDLAFSRVTGYGNLELTGQNTSLLRTYRNEEIISREIWTEIKKNERWQGPVTNYTQSGLPLRQWLTVTAIKDNANRTSAYILSFTDLSMHMGAEKTIFDASNYDGLTGLPTMNVFNEKVNQKITLAWEGGPRVTLLAIKLDQIGLFGNEPDRDGSAEVIEIATTRLLEVIRGCDLLARSGPHSFVALMVGLKNEADVGPIAQRMIKTLTRDIRVHQEKLTISTSIGCASFPVDGIEVTTLLEHAQVAMLHAFKDGGNRIRAYSQQMPTSTAPFSQAVQADFQQALAEDRLFLVYQPHIASGVQFKILACEVQLRCHQPAGDVDWNDYTSVHTSSSEQGLESTVWMIKEAGKQLKRWDDQGLRGMNLVLNLTAAQIINTAIADAVADLPADTGIDPCRLELTITEAQSALITDKTLKRLMQLKEIGVKIIISAFGSGYASLKTLKSRPFDRIKFEQRFTREVQPTRQTGNVGVVFSLQAIGVLMGLENSDPSDPVSAPFVRLKKHNGHTTESYLKGQSMLPTVLTSWARSHIPKYALPKNNG
jgi:diguanylate cyclase (GGDEF)-like protein/PAS domain S-box-containing protein